MNKPAPTPVESEEIDNQEHAVDQQSPEGDDGEMAKHSFFIAVDGDAIGAKVGQAVLHDDIEALKEVSHSINLGQNALIDFVEGYGGDVISAGGDELVAGFPQEVPMEELEAIRQKYAELVGATLTVGVGALPSEAGKALIYGKLNGKDQIAHFSPEVEDHLYQTHKNPQDEEEMKQDEHYLSSLDYSHHGPEHYDEDFDNVPDGYEDSAEDNSHFFDESHGQLEEQDSPHNAEEMPEGQDQLGGIENEHSEDEWQDPEQDSLSAEAATQAVEDAAHQENEGEAFVADDEGQDEEGEVMQAMKDELDQPEMPSEEMEDVQASPYEDEAAAGGSLKDTLAAVLESYVQEKESLEALAQQDPELYQEVLLLLQQMIVVAKKMKGEGGQVPNDQEVSPDENPHVAPQQPMGKP